MRQPWGVPLFASNEFRPHHRGASRHLFQTIGRAAGFSLHWLPESVTGVELELAIPSDFSRTFPAKRLSNPRVASPPVPPVFGPGVRHPPNPPCRSRALSPAPGTARPSHFSVIARLQ